MFDAINNDKPLPVISILLAKKTLKLLSNDVVQTNIQNCFQKAGFLEELKDEDIEDNPVSAFKQPLDELQTQNDQLIPKNIKPNILDVDDRLTALTATKAMMSDNMITREKKRNWNSK